MSTNAAANVSGTVTTATSLRNCDALDHPAIATSMASTPSPTQSLNVGG
ncbi:MAG TPA: hypothetical protein VJ456_04270 [Acidimicrobiia bacterium]|nr:hypothetical protein [Acidimicrobiia bacterium]HTC81258.1 hypothetical protein [Acidimicrobiia bacterium]